MRQRNTVQKKKIEDAMSSFTSFFNAEELHHKVIKKYPNIGIATIYRFLKDAVQQGNIHSYTCNRRTIYSTNKKNHTHFTCEKCGQTKHINIKKLDFLEEQIKASICHFQIDITGVCEECMKKNA